MAGLPVRQDYSPTDLRTRAARERDARASLQLLAIAVALEGMNPARGRPASAKLCTMLLGASKLRVLTVCTTRLARPPGAVQSWSAGGAQGPHPAWA